MSKHEERRVLPYTPAQLYELVADIEKYPEFLPWCVGALYSLARGECGGRRSRTACKIYREALPAE